MEPKLFPGEREAIAIVLALGKQYGYGNLIAWIKREWALALLADQKRYGVRNATYERALEATNVSAYPENFE